MTVSILSYIFMMFAVSITFPPCDHVQVDVAILVYLGTVGYCCQVRPVQPGGTPDPQPALADHC